MYTINQEVAEGTGSGASPIPVGINEDVKFLGVEHKKDKNQKSYISFVFEDGEGNTISHNEFEANPEYITPKEGETIDEAVARKVNNMLIRIKHICVQFVDPASFVINGDTFEQFCTNLVAFMGSKNTSKLVRLKVVYNYKDFASLPNFTPFVEPMEKSPSSLKINGKYDKMVQDSQKATTQAAGTPEVDLPF
jgi:hypothetical protein